jgi:hypothetical protein
MRVKLEVVVAALLMAAACSSQSVATKPPPPVGGQGAAGGGTGGGGEGGSGGGAAGPEAGTAPDLAPSPPATADSAAPAVDQAQATGGTGGGRGGTGGTAGTAGTGGAAGMAGTGGTGGAVTGGRALMVVGTIPLVGTDAQIRESIKARGLQVEEVRENVVTAAHADGKRLVVLSYSMLSTALKASFAETSAAVMVLEHNLLPGLGMTSAAGHGFQTNVTQITLTATDPVLTGGLPPGDVTVYSRGGSDVEVFWGVPGPGATTIATVKGNPGRATWFGYPAGAMMVGRTAPGKRLQFFFAAHAPPPVTDQLLNASGLKLLEAAIDWCLK